MRRAVVLPATEQVCDILNSWVLLVGLAIPCYSHGSLCSNHPAVYVNVVPCGRVLGWEESSVYTFMISDLCTHIHHI